ncbi:hypothetical protein THASP1DRAFT_29180 [Thamnocephalis sphaerospora]|uniref:Uncharacterized protein n=1 Tax=Thamnocephalis sphaerospora TaxID=78915 RepID=A0A4V1IWX0_9FUNG|nr:hypothetical protein THASP1DRAFT_29180 [Thamnocephalis sphaerospora]|eukprot:RKP09029.1 hypothetical protein THASP1DRAFT_29180 [Thamnocephalis sphaerospora]
MADSTNSALPSEATHTEERQETVAGSAAEDQPATAAADEITPATDVETAPVEAMLTEEELQEVVARVEALKKDGNDAFGHARYDDAKEKYREGIQLCPSQQRPELAAVLWANLAACELKQEQAAEAARSCDNALELHPAYAKARLRRAQANERVGSYVALKSALADYEQVKEESPDLAAACNAALARLPAKIKVQEEREKEEMMGKLKDLGNTILGKFGLSLDNFQMTPNGGEGGGYSMSFKQ